MNNFFKIALLVAGAILSSIFLFGKAEAQESPKIFINEVMWQGRSKNIADEWLELYNNSDVIVDIGGYSIIDETKSGDDSVMIKIEDGQIAPHSTFLISKNDKDFTYKYKELYKESYLNVHPDVVSSKLSLSNTKLKISLKDSGGDKIDIFGGGVFDPNGKENLDPYQPTGCAGTYCSLERTNYSQFGDSPDVWTLSTKQVNISLKASSSDIEIPSDVFASPTPSGRPKIVSFDLTDDSYILNNSKRIDFVYEIEDTDDDFEKVEITGQSGSLNFFKNLNTNERSFVLPKSNSCWSLKFTFLDERGLCREQLVDLNCFEQNNKIYISEVLSSPKDHDWDKNGLKDSKDEWFELYNSSKTDCDLTGWYVLDESDKEYVFNRTIKKGQFLVFHSSVTKISLNNSGEELYLYDPSGKLVSQVKIPSLAYNISYSFIDGQWYKTSVPTPNVKNEKDEEEDLQVAPSADEKESVSPVSSSTKTANQSSTGDAESVIIKKVIVRKISYNNASVYLKRKNEALVPRMDGAIVLGASSERYYNPFNLKVFLIYLLAVILLTSVFTYAIYRRE